MAHTIKQKIQIDATTLYLWITDQTGEYDPAINDTGWGDPNPELNESCLLCYLERQASEGVEEATPVSAQFIYDPVADNADEKQFQFNYINDGWYKSWLIRLMVTIDGITSVDGATILDGDYFYMSGIIYNKVAGENIVVTDYKELTEDIGLTMTMCDSYWSSKGAQKRVDDYYEYIGKRTGPCNENTVFSEVVMLREDIQGGQWAFKSGLTTHSQKLAESLIDIHNLG